MLHSMQFPSSVPRQLVRRRLQWMSRCSVRLPLKCAQSKSAGIVAWKGALKVIVAPLTSTTCIVHWSVALGPGCWQRWQCGAQCVRTPAQPGWQAALVPGWRRPDSLPMTDCRPLGASSAYVEAWLPLCAPPPQQGAIREEVSHWHSPSAKQRAWVCARALYR